MSSAKLATEVEDGVTIQEERKGKEEKIKNEKEILQSFLFQNITQHELVCGGEGLQGSYQDISACNKW